MKKKLKSYPLKEAVRNEFLRIIACGESEIYKDVLIQRLRSHEKLYKEDYKGANRSVVTCVGVLTDEFLNGNPEILITPFPYFHRTYEGWQIITNKTKINDFIRQVREEKCRKTCRKLKNTIERYLKEKSVDNKFGSLPSSKIKEIEKQELNLVNLLSHSFMQNKSK